MADAMSSPVETGPDWLTVERFRTEISANRHHCALVLVDFDGRASGLITRRQLAAVPPERRDDLRVRDVMTPLALCTTAEPDEPLAAVIQRSAVGTAGRIIVLDSGGPTGVVTAHDVTRLLQLRRLDLPQSSPVQQ
ncbi:CBS domain-containing protein [Streptomyces sp. CBMA123]|uniref:CBS domain-containing protein n=1 Tax=Streptomyces sp. CBMA123 TaxID=1896313 RepID=UPI001661B312|nr:CBS domain-containing protein [Streptomyces sp. CBMA123]MBD0688253.1 hypothetical protein [Streptomyces sp. CBMA123]